MQKMYEFPLVQGVGAASEAVVNEGERVLRGQLIAKCPDQSLGQNIHSSVTGVVDNLDKEKIIILADEVQSDDFVKLKSTDPLDIIKEAGIVGLGGAGFPTHVKLAKAFEKGGVVIVNAAECEPILDHNIEFINDFTFF